MNIHFPTFASSDAELNKTYNYRCELYQKHVKQTDDGRYVITEFLPNVSWAGIYNTICCAASHHIRDGRWLSESCIVDDYIRFWCAEGDPRLYSFPIADSVLRQCAVKGNCSLGDGLYSKLAEIHAAWDDHLSDSILYTQECDHDGMELSISGDGIRPTLNSYQYADKCALSVLAARSGDIARARFYSEEAEKLKAAINSRLWNESIGMYGVISDDGEMQNVREQIGYIPWMYGIPTDGRDGCFKFLFDTDCFLSKYGLRTAEASHPKYQIQYGHECLWNGPIWPFATSQTLSAVIEYLNSSENPVISSRDFTNQLLLYANMHRDTDGSAYIDENMDPESGVWIAREILRRSAAGGSERGKRYQNRGRHYNHSSFIDLVITGLCGLRPSMDDTLLIHPLGLSLDYFQAENISYHGHEISVLWDRQKGFSVMLNGKEAAFASAADDLTVSIKLPPSKRA